ncbi:carboxymuconolactone decarboxylase family protein [Streptomyces sp. NRRL B-24484]|uniref:carboxymuconolactone decarboxylase family protein n=1 Tax=Streptomyces sp. NRRL B-24484 TaxID=1463833 RepID=UPI000A7720AE|nr:carboxymuconolactone decarboxylase family protein [Streptomyces sp. NRRL B-24484]
MRNPAFVLPDAMKGIGSIIKAVGQGGITHELQEIVALRASQLNGCSACVHAHVQNLRKAGESEDRIAAVAAWREAPFYTDAERAALELAEQATRLADRSKDAVPDELWDRLRGHYDEEQLSALILLIGVTNFFNRLNSVVREPAGTSWG